MAVVHESCPWAIAGAGVTSENRMDKIIRMGDNFFMGSSIRTISRQLRLIMLQLVVKHSRQNKISGDFPHDVGHIINAHCAIFLVNGIFAE